MPTVPILEHTDVAIRPITPARTSPDMFGAEPRVPDASGFADQVDRIYQEQKQKSDQVAVLGAATQVSNLETTLATQTRQKLGVNAYGAPDEVAKTWNDAVGKIGGTLANDEQRMQFANVVASHWNALNDVVQSHVAQQHKVVDQQSTDGYLAAEANAAVENYMDPVRVAEAVGNTSAAIRAYGRRNGEDPAYTDAHVAENASKIHVGVIDRMLANDQDVAAQKYYDTVKDQIDAQQAPRLDEALQIGSSRRQAEVEAKRIMSTTKTRGEALDAVDQIDNPKVQDSARRRVEQLWQQKDDDAREVEAGKVQQATEIVRQTKSFDRIPPTLLVGMSAGAQEGLLRFAKALNESPSGEVTQSNMGRYIDLEKLFSDPSLRDKAIKYDLNKDAAYLTSADMKHFSDMQGGLMKADPAVQQKLDGIYTRDQVVEMKLKQAGLDVDPKAKKTEADTVNGLKLTINQQVEELAQHQKRPATSEEVAQITDQVLTQHVVSRPNFWGFLPGVSSTSESKKRLDQMGKDDTLVVRASDIPRADYRAIVQQLRARGMPLTDDAVVAAYKASLIALRPRVTP